MTHTMKVVSVKEQLFHKQGTDVLMRGWQIELQPVQPETEPEAMPSVLILTTFDPSVAKRFPVGEDVPLTIGTTRPKVALASAAATRAH